MTSLRVSQAPCTVGDVPPTSARVLAEKHNISLRTAQRYLRLGVEPPPPDCYRIGIDGKRYPAFSRRGCFKSPLHRPLAIARSHLRRVARAEGFSEGDLAILRDVAGLACELLVQWQAATRDIEPQLSHRPVAERVP